jgi:hypothetical protein
MKKILITVIVLALLGAGGYAAYLYFQKKEAAVEDILPQQPVIFVHQKDVVKTFAQFSASPFWQKISKLDYDLLASQSGKKVQPAFWFNIIKSQVFTPENQDLFQKFFGKEVAVTVYPTEIDFAQLSSGNMQSIGLVAEQALSQLFIVTKVGVDVKMAEALSRFSKISNVNVTQETVEYKKHTIHMLNFTQFQFKIGFVLIKDWMVIGLGDRAAKMCIDVIKKDKLALAKDVRFQQAKSTALAQSTSFGYGDLAQIISFLEKAAETAMQFFPSKDASDRTQIEEVFRNFRGFQTASVSTVMGNPIKANGIVHFDKAHLDPTIAELYLSCKDAPNQTLNFIPKNVLAYQWSSCTNPKYYWNQLKAESLKANEDTQSTWSAQLQLIEKMLGLSLEGDIIPALGDEFGGYLADLEIGEAFPIPRLLLFIKITDQQKISQLLQKLTEQPMLVIQKEEYNGVNIHYFSIPIASELQPGYAFVNDYLLFAVNRQMIKDAVDISKDPSRSIVHDPAFAKVNDGLSAPNSSTTYARLDLVMNKIIELTRWSQKKMADQQIQREAFKLGSESRLRDVRGQIEETENMVAVMESEIPVMEKVVSTMVARGDDVSAKKAELEALKKDAAAKKADLESFRQQEQEIADIFKNYENQSVNPLERQKALTEVVIPLFEGIGSLGTFGSWTKINDKLIETLMILSAPGI